MSIRQKKTLQKKSRQNLLFDIQKQLDFVFKTFSNLFASAASISKKQKNFITKKFFFDEMFRLLSKDLKCRIRSKAITKCVLFFLPFSISDIFIWRMNEFYCEILNDDMKFIKNFEKKVRRADNFVRLVMSQKKKSILIDEHEHYCELFQIVFTIEFKIATNRAAKLNQHLKKKIFNLNKYHDFFLQSFKEWTIKKIVWKYSTILNWYMSDSKNYIWSFKTKKTYNFFFEWRFVVQKKRAHFKQSMSFIDELFGSIDRFFSFQRRFRFIEHSLNKNENVQILRKQFVQMFVYFKRFVETIIFKSAAYQKFVQPTSKSSSVSKIRMIRNSKKIARFEQARVFIFDDSKKVARFEQTRVFIFDPSEFAVRLIVTIEQTRDFIFGSFEPIFRFVENSKTIVLISLSFRFFSTSNRFKSAFFLWKLLYDLSDRFVRVDSRSAENDFLSKKFDANYFNLNSDDSDYENQFIRTNFLFRKNFVKRFNEKQMKFQTKRSKTIFIQYEFDKGNLFEKGHLSYMYVGAFGSYK